MKKPIFLLSLFFIFSISCHKVAQLPFELFVEKFDHVLLKRLLVSFLFIVFLVLGAALFRKLYNHPKRSILLENWGVALGLVAICICFLMPYKAESMHLFQYAIMGGLSLKYLKNAFAALNLSFLLGAIDEFFQYWISWSAYVDFNDIILNFGGSFLGVLLVATFASHSTFNSRKTISPKVLYSVNASIGSFLLIGLATQQVCFFSDEDCFLHLCAWPSTQPSPNFFNLWETLSWGDQWHRIRPIPGALSFILLPLTGLRLNKI